jgi:hypothetical protein
MNGFILQLLDLNFGLTFDGSYTGENLTLDGLEQGTTTSRDVRYLVGQTKLGAACNRVATTNQ